MLGILPYILFLASLYPFVPLYLPFASLRFPTVLSLHTTAQRLLLRRHKNACLPVIPLLLISSFDLQYHFLSSAFLPIFLGLCLSPPNSFAYKHFFHSFLLFHCTKAQALFLFLISPKLRTTLSEP